MTREEVLLEAKKAFKDGRIIESGLIRMLASAPPDLPEDDLVMMRFAFFYASRYIIMTLFDPPGRTKQEKRRALNIMSAMLRAELQRFDKEIDEGLAAGLGEASKNLH